MFHNNYAVALYVQIRFLASARSLTSSTLPKMLINTSSQKKKKIKFEYKYDYVSYFFVLLHLDIVLYRIVAKMIDSYTHSTIIITLTPGNLDLRSISITLRRTRAKTGPVFEHSGWLDLGVFKLFQAPFG